MGFVAILLAAVAGLGVWMIRARAATEAAKGALDVADDVRAAIRRFGYKRSTRGNPLDGIEDTRLSAAGMMWAVARLDGDTTREQNDRITRECVETFEVDAAEATDIAAYGRWLAQQGESEEVMRRLARSLRGKLDSAQQESLLAMLERIASVEGGSPSNLQRDAFAVVGRVLG